MIILYAVPISPWPMLGKENRYFYTRHYINNDSTTNLKRMFIFNHSASFGGKGLYTFFLIILKDFISIIFRKDAVFLLYNCARVVQILYSFDQSVQDGVYTPLPSKVDWTLLDTQVVLQKRKFLYISLCVSGTNIMNRF